MLPFLVNLNGIILDHFNCTSLIRSAPNASDPKKKGKILEKRKTKKRYLKWDTKKSRRSEEYAAKWQRGSGELEDTLEQDPIVT